MNVSTLANSASVAMSLLAVQADTATSDDDETAVAEAAPPPPPPPPSSGSGADSENLFMSLFGETEESSSTTTLTSEEETFDLDGDGSLSAMEQAAYDASIGEAEASAMEESALAGPPSGPPPSGPPPGPPPERAASSAEEDGVSTAQSVLEELATTNENAETADAQDDMRRVEQFERLLAETLGDMSQV